MNVLYNQLIWYYFLTSHKDLYFFKYTLFSFTSLALNFDFPKTSSKKPQSAISIVASFEGHC
jgi:hypothetical protein